MNTGSIIDFYDDPYGMVLKSKLAYAQLPDFIRKANFQDDEKLASLPDDAFALVMVDRGEKIRKYACVDKGNTALSAIYFLENKDKLPEEAQKVAAANIASYCQLYGLDVPFQLQKTADMTGSPIMPLQSNPTIKDDTEGYGELMATKKLSSGDVDNGDDAKIASVSVETAVTSLAKLLGHGGFSSISDDPKVVANARAGALIGAGFGALLSSGVDGSDKGKKDFTVDEGLDLTKHMNPDEAKRVKEYGTDLYKKGPLTDRHPKHLHDLYNKDKKKKFSALYVDVTGQVPKTKLASRTAQRYCLVKEGQGRFPIDSYGDVLDANRWFEENSRDLHPEDRKEFCTKLAARADELGISVTDNIRKYASDKFATRGDIEIAVATRQQFWSDGSNERGLLNGLMDKYASVAPDVFCEALRQFDESTGLSHFWDSEVLDPWASTYGFTKEASWEWVDGDARLTEQELVRGVQDSGKIYQVRQRFGEDMAKELADKPITVFSSLPLDTKRILSRLFSDPQ